MRWMHKLVIPEVSYCWKKIADFLEYPASKKKEIGVRQHSDPYNCCAELMEDWLNSDQGGTPKTWHKLLSVLEEIKELSRVTYSIKQNLLKEGQLYENTQ